MEKYEIKCKDNYGNWQHLPGLPAIFDTKNEAIDYINEEILGGVWGQEWAEMDPNDIEIFKV